MNFSPDNQHFIRNQKEKSVLNFRNLLLDFSLTVKAATLIFISGYGSAISSAKEGKSGFIYNLVKSKSVFLGRSIHENPNRIHTELNIP